LEVRFEQFADFDVGHYVTLKPPIMVFFSIAEEDINLVSKVETKGFTAPIASIDEDDEGVTKVVTYRTNTTTTTRVVSWPGTYFFKPIDPGARQQTLPEDVGLLFGIDNVNPYKGLACCDHLKPVDPAVKTAQGKGGKLWSLVEEG
jgi:hypothetical protein